MIRIERYGDNPVWFLIHSGSSLSVYRSIRWLANYPFSLPLISNSVSCVSGIIE